MSNKHKGGHGGAWKVAYADFVTAMMALFLVLWLTSQDTKIKEAVERSFKNPFASLSKESTGILPNKDTQAVKNTQGNFDSAAAVELNFLRKISEEIIKNLQPNPEPPEDETLQLEVTPEGIRISVFDRVKRPIFGADSARFTPYGEWVFTTLAWQVAAYTNLFLIELEGHTQKGYALKNDQYGVWELSTDRANAARRKLLDHGLPADQIRKVAGFADTMPLKDCVPTDERNRRVSLLLKVNNARKHSDT
jgi:chemotaxis protein MotB